MDGSYIRKEKVADSKRYGYTCGRGLPVLEEVFFNIIHSFFYSVSYNYIFITRYNLVITFEQRCNLPKNLEFLKVT